jgi:hypothetical protein
MVDDLQKSTKKFNLKKFLPFIIFGAVIVLFLASRRNQNGGSGNIPVDETGVGGTAQGISNDMTGQLFNDLATSIAGENDKIYSAISDMGGNFEGKISALDAKIEAKTAEQAEKVDLSSNNTVYERVSNMIPFGTIYNDDIPDDIQYNQIQRTVNQSDLIYDKQQELKKQVSGLGNNGVGWTPSSGAELNKRLESQDFRNSEMDRAKLVIENRRKEGLSTTLQEKYLKKLEAGGKV